MLKRVNAIAAGEYTSAFAVVVVAAMTGARAAEGMSALQWAGGLAAVAGTVAWAVMVRVWPMRARSQA
ncbi:MAG: hypothetical protein JWP35_2017 [Caulobacter sp.]|jgi:hypothetical protein|nr:hypothetical protein [Caulobacter sp.]